MSSSFDEGHVLQYLAQNYRYSGGSLDAICTHNSEVARHVERHQIAQTWLVLRLLYGEATQQRPPVIAPALPVVTVTTPSPSSLPPSAASSVTSPSSPSPHPPIPIDTNNPHTKGETPAAPPPPVAPMLRASVNEQRLEVRYFFDAKVC